MSEDVKNGRVGSNQGESPPLELLFHEARHEAHGGRGAPETHRAKRIDHARMRLKQGPSEFKNDRSKTIHSPCFRIRKAVNNL